MKRWLGVVGGIAMLGTCVAGWRATGSVEASTVQGEQGNVSVTEGGAPAAGVDVFALINAGKQPMGTTNTVGQLPFDPALLTGKVRVEVAVRECPDRREVYFVEGEPENACDEVERASTAAENEDCDCDVAGAIWWGDALRVDVVDLTASGASAPLTSNPVFWTGLAGGGAATALIVASGTEDEETTSTPPFTGGSGTTTTSAPPTTTTSTPADPNGTYGIDVTGVNDPGRHREFTGDPPNTIEIVTRENGDFSAFGQPPWVEVHGSIDADGRFRATGRGTVAGRSNVMVVFEGQIDMMTFRLTGTYRMGTNRELPGGDSIDFMLAGQKR
jgi:hypothetical protein